MKDDKELLSVLIGSCDKYNHLWKNFDILFKRYWHLDTKNVFVSETIKMPYKNYISVTPGINLQWTDIMLQGLNEIKTPYVCLILEDYYLTEPITSKFIREHIQILEKHNADKIMFDKIYPPDIYTLKYLENNLYVFEPHSDYLNSVQPAIWKTEYLAHLLRVQSCNPWQFEVEGNRYTQQLNPKIILNARERPVYFNYTRNGGIIADGWQDVFSKEGLTTQP